MRRLKEEFGEPVQKKVSRSRWEVVKQGKTSRVEKVKKKVARLGIVTQSWDRNWGRSADMHLMPNGNVGSSSY